MEIESKRKLVIAKSNATATGNVKQFATACNKLARHYFEEDNFEAALSEYEDELEANKKLEDRLKTALCHRMISEIHLKFDEFVKAAEHARYFYQLSKEEENVVEQQRAVLTLGRIFLNHASSLLTEDSDSEEGHKLAKKSEEMLNKSLFLITKIKNVPKKEIQEMIAVALLNIGLNYEIQKRNDDALKKFESATSVCVKYDIYDTLYRCYISLGAFHASRADFNKAVNYLSLSISTAERLGDKEEKMASSRIDKAKIYFKMGEHLQAQSELMRANKLRVNSEPLKREIKLNLKRANTLCRLQRDLQRTPLDAHLERKSLFERSGDVLSSMGLYGQALSAYENMLSNSEAAGDMGKKLLPAFVSLAATYMDDGQYQRAAEFYLRELREIGDNAEEACRTLLNLGVALEKASAPYHEVAERYASAKQLAQRAGKTRLAVNALQHLADLQSAAKLDGLADESRRELATLAACSDSDDSSTQDCDTQDVLLDTSSDDDAVRTERTRGRTLKVTRNEKGETPLHRACIEGHVGRTRSLLDQGHPVNVRDNAGWLPIHEACSFDRVEIAELLLDRGAWIDDPGDAHCDGVTPLIDACCNGHLDSANLLMDRGANLLSRNTNGETALDCLLGWFRRADKSALSSEFINNFQQIEDRLRKAYIKAGVSKDELPRKSIDSVSGSHAKDKRVKNLERVAKSDDETQENAKHEATRRIATSKRRNNDNLGSSLRKKQREIGSLRNCVESSDSESDCGVFRPISPHIARGNRDQVFSMEDDDGLLSSSLTTSSSERPVPAAQDYVDAMQNVRHRVHEPVPPRAMIEDRPALVGDDEVGDDWLDDDIGLMMRKRRKSDGIGKSFIGQPQKSSVQRLRLPASLRGQTLKTRTRTMSSSDEDLPPTAESTTLKSQPTPVKTTPIKLIDVTDSPLQSRSRLQQPSLINSFGFSRKVSDSRSKCRYEPLQVQSEPKEFASITSAQVQSIDPSQALSQVQGQAQTHGQGGAVRIRIEGTLFLVPALPTQTIGALALEAARRYFNVNGVKPSLSLLTRDGALLAREDPVSLIIGTDEVVSNVDSWHVPPLSERYQEACRSLESDWDTQAATCLKNCHSRNELALEDLALTARGLEPVLRALHGQDAIVRLDLTGNLMRDDGIKMLADSLHKMGNLEDLIIGSNLITDLGLLCLSNVLVNNTTLAQKLKLLDLSHNSLSGKHTLPALADILDRVALRSLNLRSCLLTADTFQCVGHTMPRLLNLEAIESLDISYNRLGGEGVAFFIGRLDPERLVNLNLACTSRPDTQRSEIARELVLFLEPGATALRALNLARNQVNDADLDQLSNVLSSTRLDTLNLAGNELDTRSLHAFLGGAPSVTCLDVTACGSLEGDWMENAMRLKSLSVSDVDSECRSLERIWRNVWQDKAVCRRGPMGFLCLSVKQ